jgi:hypothetical protein
MEGHYCSLLKIHLPEKEDFDFLSDLSKRLQIKSCTLESDCTLFGV